MTAAIQRLVNDAISEASSLPPTIDALVLSQRHLLTAWLDAEKKKKKKDGKPSKRAQKTLRKPKLRLSALAGWIYVSGHSHTSCTPTFTDICIQFAPVLIHSYAIGPRGWQVADKW